MKITKSYKSKGGLATETTLAAILSAVDQGFSDGLEGLLTALGTNTDGLEGFTDGLEGLITSSNSLLTSIRDNADTVESLLSALGTNTDGVEGLVTATNALLTTIRDNADTVESLLTTIRDNADALETLTGSLTEAAPASDTASSGLNGRLQRIAQRLTSLIALLPTSLGQKTMANSFAVVLASDQSNVPTVNPPQSTSTFAPTNSTSVVLEASRVIKAAAGTIYGITGHNDSNTAQFIHIYNSTTVPANGAVPVVVFRVAGRSTFTLDWGIYGRFFSTGVSISNSSTLATKTIGAADCWFDVQYQ
jgi:uncharacterized protein YoxC